MTVRLLQHWRRLLKLLLGYGCKGFWATCTSFKNAPAGAATRLRMSRLPVNASWVEALPDGHQGTWRTLQVMAFLVRKDYQSRFVNGFVSQLLHRAQRINAVSALFFYARDAIRFIDDPPGIEKVSDFEHTTRAGAGDCDDKAVWLATALFSIDTPARFAVQSYGATWDHVFIEYYDFNLWRWVALDPTADGHTGLIAGPGWRQPLGPEGYETTFQI